MHQAIKFVLLCLCIINLTACQTTNQTTYAEEQKKMTAARINDRLGMAYLERHDIHRAKQKFLLALEQAPNIPETWYSMAYFLESTGNRNKANIYYQKAVKLAPQRGDVLNNYGTFLCRSGDYQKAVGYFMKATQDPKYLELASVYENAGLCSLKIPNAKIAKAYFNRALIEDPNRATSILELAELNFKQGHYALARHQLDKYLQFAAPSAQSYQLEQGIDEKLRA